MPPVFLFFFKRKTLTRLIDNEVVNRMSLNDKSDCLLLHLALCLFQVKTEKIIMNN
jgi:hypothetical protein